MFMKLMTSRTAVWLMIFTAATMGHLNSTGSADDKDSAKPSDDPLRKARMQFLADASKHFEIRVGNDQVEAKQPPEPVLNYNNPVSGTKLGMMTLFARNGRPDVIAQFAFFSPQKVIHDFYNVSSEKVVMTRDASRLWTPAETYTKWKPLKTTETPAATPALRLIQMRRLADKFTVEDYFGQEQKERHELRLLSTPVYRYGKSDESLVDGAVFVFALATDPEAVLMLECVRSDAGLSWQYAFGPMTIYELKAKLDGDVVWEIPERKQFKQQNSMQYCGQYQLEPGETYPE